MNYLCNSMGLLPVSLAMRQFFSGGIQSQQARLCSTCGAVAILGTGVKTEDRKTEAQPQIAKSYGFSFLFFLPATL